MDPGRPHASELPTSDATQSVQPEAVVTVSLTGSPRPNNPWTSVQVEVVTQPEAASLSEPHEPQHPLGPTTATYDSFKLLPAEPPKFPNRRVTEASDSETEEESRLCLSLRPSLRPVATPPLPGVACCASTAGSSLFLAPPRLSSPRSPLSKSPNRRQGSGQAGNMSVSLSLRPQLLPLPLAVQSRNGMGDCPRPRLPPPLPVADGNRRGTKLGSLVGAGSGNGSQCPAATSFKHHPDQLAHSLSESVLSESDRICSRRQSDSADIHRQRNRCDSNFNANRSRLNSPQPLTAMSMGGRGGSLRGSLNGFGSCSAPELMAGCSHSFHLPEYDPRPHDTVTVSPHGQPVASTSPQTAETATATPGDTRQGIDAPRRFKRGTDLLHPEMRRAECRDEGFVGSSAEQPACAAKGDAPIVVASTRIPSLASALLNPADVPQTEAAVPPTVSGSPCRTANMLPQAVPQAEGYSVGLLLQQLNSVQQRQCSGSGATLSALTTTPLIGNISQKQCCGGTCSAAVISTNRDASSDLQGSHACDKQPVPSSLCVQKSSVPLDAAATNAVVLISSPASRVIHDSASVYAKQMEKIKAAIRMESQYITGSAWRLSGTKRQRGMDKTLIWSGPGGGVCGQHGFMNQQASARCGSDHRAQKGMLRLELPDLNI